jgi:hypothetical protein
MSIDITEKRVLGDFYNMKKGHVGFSTSDNAENSGTLNYQWRIIMLFLGAFHFYRKLLAAPSAGNRFFP